MISVASQKVLPQLCKEETAEGPCLLRASHAGQHRPRPTLWTKISDDPGGRTGKKIVKAGFATPRGGAKGGYQNHVSRSSRVIIPYEHVDKVSFDNYEQGAVVRLTIPQATDLRDRGLLREEEARLFVDVEDPPRQAFALYRSLNDDLMLPVPEEWIPCEHQLDGEAVNRRSSKGKDLGHYLRRVPKERGLGPPQGIFAPEYTNKQTNFECQVLLTHLAYRTEGHTQDDTAFHVEAILLHLGLYDEQAWAQKGVVDEVGLTACPLCGRRIASPELHETIDPSQVPGLANSGVQLAETRSTLVNLYHLSPLLYSPHLGHTPTNIAWGHAHCNTLLAQRASYSLAELQAEGAQPKLDLFWDTSETFIRSSDNRAWVSVTPVPPGKDSFTTYLDQAGATGAVEEEDEADDERD